MLTATIPPIGISKLNEMGGIDKKDATTLGNGPDINSVFCQNCFLTLLIAFEAHAKKCETMDKLRE